MPEPTALKVAARTGLVPPTGLPVLLDDTHAPSWQAVTRQDRLGGLLTAALAEGSLVADEPASDLVADIWHKQLIASVVVEALVLRTADVLAAANVTWRLTKGAAVAHLDYPDPSLRPFGDADILIHPDDWDVAVAALLEAGCRRSSPELDPQWDNRFGKGATLNAPEGLEIDLHRRFAIGRFGVRSRMHELYEGGESITLAGRHIPTLDGAGRLLHSCHHAALGGYRHFRAHRDIAQQLLVTGVDWTSAVETATRWKVDAVVARAITDAWRVLGLTVHHPAVDWARAARIPLPDRWALDVFAEERPFRNQALTVVGAMSWRDLPAYFRPLAARPGSLRRLTHRMRRR